MTAVDVIARRTRLAFLDSHAAEQVPPRFPTPAKKFAQIRSRTRSGLAAFLDSHLAEQVTPPRAHASTPTRSRSWLPDLAFGNEQALPRVLDIMAQELRWSNERKDKESKVLALFRSEREREWPIT